jgi:hypothetical protein
MGWWLFRGAAREVRERRVGAHRRSAGTVSASPLAAAPEPRRGVPDGHRHYWYRLGREWLRSQASYHVARYLQPPREKAARMDAIEGKVLRLEDEFRAVYSLMSVTAREAGQHVSAGLAAALAEPPGPPSRPSAWRGPRRSGSTRRQPR